MDKVHYKRMTICGSMRNRNEMLAANAYFSFLGYLVWAPPILTETIAKSMNEDNIQKLKFLQREKIRKSTVICFVLVDETMSDYITEQYEYAVAENKEIIMWYRNGKELYINGILQTPEVPT